MLHWCLLGYRRLLVCAVNSYPLSEKQYYIATASAGDSVYVLDNKYDNPSSSSHKYSAATDVWATINKIPTWRAATEHGASAATVGNTIYVMGGTSGPNSPPAPKNEAYNTQTDAWITKSPLPVGLGRAGAAIGVSSGTIIVAGGYPLLSSVQLYNVSADSWRAGEGAVPRLVRRSVQRRGSRGCSYPRPSFRCRNEHA
jgi:hypothetical protein